MELYQTAATGDNIIWLNFTNAVYCYDEHCASYACEKPTTHCRMQHAALSPPNIQRLCSNPPEIQTCFVSGAVFANPFESTHLNSFIKLQSQWLVILRYIFEGNRGAWTDPNLKPGIYVFTFKCKTNKWMTIFPWCILFFCQIGCMNALLLRLWIYGLWADNISVPFGLHFCSWDWSPFIFQ